MTIYGSEFTFPVPVDMTAEEFGDKFDQAIEGLTSADGFFSIDAIQSGDLVTMLVGINVPEDADADTFYPAVITDSLVPALEGALLLTEPLVQLTSANALALAH